MEISYRIILLAVLLSLAEAKFFTLTRESLQWSDEGDCGELTNRKSAGIPLIHKQSKCSRHRNPESPWLAAVIGPETAKNDAERYRTLTSGILNSEPLSKSGVRVSPGGGGPNNYIATLGLGTPAQQVELFLDTGSPLTWAPCRGITAFVSSRSSTYQAIPCSSQLCSEARLDRLGGKSGCGGGANETCPFDVNYGDGSDAIGELASDSVDVGSSVVSKLVFGCALSSDGLSLSDPGILGLDRLSDISFLSQTATNFRQVFSYCLPSFQSSSGRGSLTFGVGASGPSTPLLTNTKAPEFYYVGLTGITVGGNAVAIPSGALSFDSSSGRGFVVDSGTVVTRLVADAYGPFRDAFRQQFNGQLVSPPGDARDLFDTCFELSSQGSVLVPQVTFNFQGLNLALSLAQTVVPVAQSASFTIYCLAFSTPPAGTPISIFGNVQQQDMLVGFDIPNARVSFQAQNCG